MDFVQRMSAIIHDHRADRAATADGHRFALPATNNGCGVAAKQVSAFNCDRIAVHASLTTTGICNRVDMVAGEIDSFKVGGGEFPLTAGASSDTAGLLVGATGDLRMREI